MSRVAIRTAQLGKQCRVGERERYKALRDTMAAAARASCAGDTSGERFRGKVLLPWRAKLLDDVSF